jgi:hypothetical protein
VNSLIFNSKARKHKARLLIKNKILLPPKYSHLFQGNIRQRLEDPINNKMMWIFSVWSARDNDINIGPMQLCNSHIVNLFDRWKSKNAIKD